MRVNFRRSEMIPLNLDENRIHKLAHVLNCHVGVLPFRYLGVPLHYKKLKREDVQPLVDKLMKRMAGWKGKMLAYSSRLFFIRSCLANVHVYLLSFIKFLKWAIKLLESQMAHCLWSTDSDRHRYHLANWQLVSMKKEYGSLGVPSPKDLNLCLLGSWDRRYCVDKDKI
jgi:hypothetical protein